MEHQATTDLTSSSYFLSHHDCRSIVWAHLGIVSSETLLPILLGRVALGTKADWYSILSFPAQKGDETESSPAIPTRLIPVETISTNFRSGKIQPLEMSNMETPSPHPDLNRSRLPTLYEVLSRQTLAPVDLFSFYIFMRDQQRSVDYLDFWYENLLQYFLLAILLLTLPAQARRLPAHVTLSSLCP